MTALARGYHELSAERQDVVRSFLARKIDEARGDAAADCAADWKDQLAQALDYRGWLRLSLQYRPGGGSPWAVFDAARHAAKSGGEKVVLLSQPLFAAAVVAYDAASPHAPRWVWLDEAMTGVDAAVKASFMGLTVDFALDVMLTAHDEWCNYVTVPAVAVYDLARQVHVPGVDAMPYLWSGGNLTAVEMGQLGVTSGNLRTLIEQVSHVWRRLPEPAQPRVRLAQLAATTWQDAHALDYREELGRAVSRLIAVTHRLPRPLSAGRDWRRAWAAVGVLVTRCRPACSSSISRYSGRGRRRAGAPPHRANRFGCPSVRSPPIGQHRPRSPSSSVKTPPSSSSGRRARPSLSTSRLH
ncbi:SbcC/MukB-like Walker B domain-containing protein [Phytohabitans houttuyneae]|uniref:SbcC/MukB-like Walker B domain-containing protein n=1 Tax=Phytohabitans houttuyneae TaxID=1076126 RepID=UPI001C49B54F|nr:SbcC/MukB-like Walker B domain-containing protein [Phytohabitans houttuyneae]